MEGLSEALRLHASGRFGEALSALERFFDSDKGQEARKNGLSTAEERSGLRVFAQLSQAVDPLRAIELSEELCDNDEKVFGKGSREYALSLLEAAESYQELESPDLDRATELRNCCEKILRTLAGDAPLLPVNEAALLYAQGSILFDRNRYAEAIAVLSRATETLSISENSTREEREEMAAILNVLSLSHQEQGDYQSALKYRNEEMAISRMVGGINHPDYATSLESLSDLHCDMRARCLGLISAKSALEIRRNCLGADHPETVAAQEEMSDILRMLRKNVTSRSASRLCFSCGKIGEKLLRCSTCRQAWYCGESCRQEDKKNHDTQCGEWAEVSGAGAEVSGEKKGKKKKGAEGKKK